LAQAERSTSSRGAPTTFSHQVSVHTLDKDHHALVRCFQFDHDGAKLEVGHGLEVCAYAVGVGAGKSASPRHRAILRRAARGAHYALPPPVLPVLPNGSPVSFRSSIPISTLGTTSWGAWAELARSPPARRTAEDTGSVEMSVPLEFDEDGDRPIFGEDGEALLGNGEDHTTSISTPAKYQLAPARGR
ncbi:hypothetical protein B0H10DRAFT_1860002, partial [Mycena sp. CBHHK59/15]